ncbi:unnamed protein product, partial [Linum tenue]
MMPCCTVFRCLVGGCTVFHEYDAMLEWLRILVGFFFVVVEYL